MMLYNQDAERWKLHVGLHSADERLEANTIAGAHSVKVQGEQARERRTTTRRNRAHSIAEREAERQRARQQGTIW